MENTQLWIVILYVTMSDKIVSTRTRNQNETIITYADSMLLNEEKQFVDLVLSQVKYTLNSTFCIIKDLAKNKNKFESQPNYLFFYQGLHLNKSNLIILKIAQENG